MTENNISMKWLTFDEIKPHKEKIYQMEYELIQKYHYPTRYIPGNYVIRSVDALEDYINKGNTYFLGIFSGFEFVGYYWAYVSIFIDKPRWNLRSFMIDSAHRGAGLGKKAVEEGFKKALEIGCYDAATEYVPSNSSVAKLYAQTGYSIARIEVVKKL